MKTRFAACALGLLATIACGSTVQQTGGQGVAAGAGSGDRLSADGSGLSAPGQITPGAGISDASTTSGADAASGVVTGGGAPVAGAGGQAPVGSTAVSGGNAPMTSRGVTAGSVTIGLQYLKNVGAAAKAAGLGDLTVGDGLAQSKALVAELNRTGGIAGRTIIPVYDEVDPTQNQSNPEQNWEESCTRLTQDRKVFAVVSYVAASGTMADCLRKRGTVFLNSGTYYTQQINDRNNGFFYAPGAFVVDRLYLRLADELAANGFLTKASKIGLITFDRPETRFLADRVVKPALARRGLTVVETVYMTPNDTGAAESGAFVLQFRQKGVDRVIPIVANPVFFMQQAESQGYKPKYGLTSAAGPASLLQGTVPGQLGGAVGIGYQVYNDVDASHRPKDVNTATRRCFAIMQKAGQQASSGIAQAVQTQLCDGLFFLEHALRGVTALTPATLRERARAVGRSYVTPATFAADFSNGRTDGAAAYRPFAFKADCSCFEYTGGNKAA